MTLLGSTITETAKLKLFNIMQNGTSTREPMDLSVFVDGSVVEVYANDVSIITTRV
jgi:beta-fructofuranosidase